MPYINETLKTLLDAGTAKPGDAGGLTYALTKQVDDYLMSKGKRFATIAEVLGALEATKAEFYRRIVIPYEDQKRAENGDVYRSAE